MSNVEDWERRHALHPVLSYLVIGIALVMGLTFLGVGISQLWSLHKSKSWPHTQGVILQSRWVPGGYRDEDGSPQIVYRYTVDGQSYEGDNILPGLNESLTRDARATVRHYPVGASVTVFYDPSNYQDSCLEIGVLPELPYLMLGLGAFFILTSTALGWRMRKGRPIPFVGHGTEPPPVIEDYNLFPKDK